MSNLYDFLEELRTAETHKDYVVKYIRARDLIHCLKAPDNMVRDLKLVPDVEVRMLLSTTGKQPDFIREKIQQSENRGGFTDESLLGLCLNGRGLDPEIFLNGPQMAKYDPTGALFDEIAWHEYMHAVEGISVLDKKVTRSKPWSYAVQEVMLRIDAECAHDTGLAKYPDTQREYITYLREGTSLQENVSEIFARVGVLFYNNIQETGHALTPQDMDFFDPATFDDDWDLKDRKKYNLTDLFQALATFSPDAQGAFWHVLPKALEKVGELYGCRSPS